jgi:hypothetical protein
MPKTKKRLKAFVFVTDENGQAHEFGPGDSLPAWAEKAITNPACFESVDEDPEAPPAPAARARTATSAQKDAPEGTADEAGEGTHRRDK